jgi:hypothetical protein
MVTACADNGDDKAPSAAPAPTPSPTPSPAPVPSPSPGGGGAAIPINGGERIAWIQDAESLAAARAFNFVVYVDGARSSLAGVSCADASGQAECSAPLPRLSSGRHTLEIAAVAAGKEGEKSTTITVEVGAASASLERGEVTSASGPPPVSEARTEVCAERDPSTCFQIDTIAEGLSDAEGLAVLPDGRVVWIQAGRRLLILHDGEAVVAYDAADHRDLDARIVGLAVDPAFASSRLVYAALVTPDTSDTGTLSVVRLREVADTFGEAAIVVPGVPVATVGRTAVTIGADGYLYVATPAGDRVRHTPDAGMVLRFDSAGAAAGIARLATPVLSAGTASPGALTWDHTRLWLTARHERTADALAIVPLSATPEASRLRIGTPDMPDRGTGVSQFVIVPGVHEPPRSADAFFVSEAPSQLFGATIAYDEGALPRITGVYAVPLGDVAIRAIAMTPDRDLIALVTPAIGTAASALLRLRVHRR